MKYMKVNDKVLYNRHTQQYILKDMKYNMKLVKKAKAYNQTFGFFYACYLLVFILVLGFLFMIFTGVR